MPVTPMGDGVLQWDVTDESLKKPEESTSDPSDEEIDDDIVVDPERAAEKQAELEKLRQQAK